MIVMPANNNAMVIGYLAGKYPGRLGHLYSPGGFRGPYEFLPYALDNGRFPAWSHSAEWDEGAFVGMLERASGSGQDPRWLLVPDVVGDRDGTLREWDNYLSRMSRYGWPLAFAVQDGMQSDDVPDEAAVVFVGGTTEWKRATLHGWCEDFPRVHVGRINTNRWLWECHQAGAESCDGTGWMRGDKGQLQGLKDYLELSSQVGASVQRGLFQRTCLQCHKPVASSYAECPKCHVPANDRDRRVKDK